MMKIFGPINMYGPPAGTFMPALAWTGCHQNSMKDQVDYIRLQVAKLGMAGYRAWCQVSNDVETRMGRVIVEGADKEVCEHLLQLQIPNITSFTVRTKDAAISRRIIAAIAIYRTTEEGVFVWEGYNLLSELYDPFSFVGSVWSESPDRLEEYRRLVTKAGGTVA